MGEGQGKEAGPALRLKYNWRELAGSGFLPKEAFCFHWDSLVSLFSDIRQPPRASSLTLNGLGSWINVVRVVKAKH